MRHRFGVFGAIVTTIAVAATVAFAAEFRGMGLRVQLVDDVGAVNVRVRNASTTAVTVTSIHVFIEHQGGPVETPITWAAPCVGQTVPPGRELRCRGAGDIAPLGATTGVFILDKSDGTKLQFQLVA
jgi:hypothetical protein